MILEKFPKFEKIGRGREKLLAFEKEGKFVFHGSPDIIEMLEPRQAKDYNEETGEEINDGKPAVFATPFVDVAIFRSLVNEKISSDDARSSIGIDNNRELHFSAVNELVDQAKTRTGRVYILDKQKFGNYRGLDCRCEEPVAPIDVVEVSFEDLPPNIKPIKGRP